MLAHRSPIIGTSKTGNLPIGGNRVRARAGATVRTRVRVKVGGGARGRAGGWGRVGSLALHKVRREPRYASTRSASSSRATTAPAVWLTFSTRVILPVDARSATGSGHAHRAHAHRAHGMAHEMAGASSMLARSCACAYGHTSTRAYVHMCTCARRAQMHTSHVRMGARTCVGLDPK